MGLFHIVSEVEWNQARALGLYRPPSLAADGFIHLSTDRQLLPTAAKWFKGQRGLLVLSIRADRLRAELRFDPVGDQAFPHLYGPLQLDAVVDVMKLPVAADGTFELPRELRPWRTFFT
jgi:uncharacterized protein (DUF952 family)